MSSDNEVLEWLYSLSEAAVKSGQDAKADRIKQRINIIKDDK